MARVPSPLISPGNIILEYGEAEAAHLATTWLSVFGKNRRGANTKAFLWHIFSGARYPSVSGAAAIAQYTQQTGAEFVVLANNRRVAVLTDLLPLSSALSDYYVFPPNLAWTMAFTHEDGWLGPYFAHHPNYVRLNEANQLKFQKAREAAAAHEKGWH